MTGFRQRAGRAVSVREGESDAGDLLLDGLHNSFSLFDAYKFLSERERLAASADKGTTLIVWWDVRIYNPGNWVSGDMPIIEGLFPHVVARYVEPRDGMLEWRDAHSEHPPINLFVDGGRGHRQEWWRDSIQGTRIPAHIHTANKQKKGVLKK